MKNRDQNAVPGWLYPASILILALALYIPTLAPGLLWGGGDFATFQLKAYLLEIDVPSGIFGHPLWVVLAHPFTWLPVRDVAWRANLASAVFAAGALILVFLTACRLTRSTPASLLATAALAVSHTFWTYAVMAKVYSLNALLLIACIYLLLLWGEKNRSGYLWGFAFLYGLSLLNHLVMATAAAGFLAYIGMVAWRRRGEPGLGRQLALGALAWAVGVAPYLFLLTRTGTTGSAIGTVLGFLRGLGYVALRPQALLLGIGVGLALLLYQFPVTFLPGFLGLRQLARQAKPEAWMLGLAALGDGLFLLAAADPQAGGEYWWNLHYYLQMYVVFSLWIAVGFAALWPRFARRRWAIPAVVLLAVVLPVILYALAPAVARPFVSNLPGFRLLPGRDNLTYVLSPWKHRETGAREFGERILSALPPDSVLFADYSIWAVIRYLQMVEGARPDVELVQLTGDQVSLILRYRDHPDLFLADVYRYYDLEGIGRYFQIQPAGPVYRLVPK
ncbi:MAG: protein O-mannosyl-transferase family [Anaerolineae bacterium]